MDETYDSLDRVTIATWRASNVFGWGAAALGAALALHTVADEFTRRVHIAGWYGSLNRRPIQDFSTAGALAPSYGYKAFVSILIGGLIGWIIGAKVWKQKVKVAAGVAGGYVLISWFFLEYGLHVARRGTSGNFGITYSGPRHGLASSGLEWTYSLVALVAIPIAAVIARFVAKRRSTDELSPGTLG